MNLDQTVRLAEMILAFALLQQSIEMLYGLRAEKIIAGLRVLLSFCLLFGFQVVAVEFLLLVCGFILLMRFRGPYNGGSDSMTLLVLLCLWVSHLAPNQFWRELALGYLSFQLVFSYVQSGWVKIANSDWRSGNALRDVFAFSAYPVSENLRNLATSTRLMLTMSWLVILFELLFPLSLFNQWLLMIALGIAAIFHLANAFLFGLNRFFWIWPAAYPVIIWFQSRVFV
jgi:Vitamin K-dependent gamma-carboxylase